MRNTSQLDAVLQQNQDVFSRGSEPIKNYDILPIRIETEGPPICQQAYRTPLTKRALVEEAVQDMLKDGVIRPSNSSWPSTITLVQKKDVSTRF